MLSFVSRNSIKYTKTYSRVLMSSTANESRLPYSVAEYDGKQFRIVDELCSKDSSAILKSLPRGAYTSARTVDQMFLFDYEMHLERLQNSFRGIFSDTCGETTDALNQLPSITKQTVRCAVSHFNTQHENSAKCERKITMLAYLHEKLPESHAKSEEQNNLLTRLRVVAHVTTLPPPPQKPVKVWLLGHPRGNPVMKDSQWVSERVALEEAKPADVNEVILCDDQGKLYEGSQSNVFVVKDKTLYTAEDGILKGTIRAEMLEVCQMVGIPVVLEPPREQDLETWDELIIASTSRLVLPVQYIAMPRVDTEGKVVGDSLLRERHLPAATPVADMLQDMVLKRLKLKSSPIFDDALQHQ